jgi:hypothetical protein
MQKYGGLTQQATDAKYRSIQQALNQGMAVSADDRSFVKAYEKQKTLVPVANFQMNQGKVSDARLDRSYQFNASALTKVGDPIEQLSARVGRLKETLAQGTPQADALVAPELLTVMAGGQGSGLRMNEAEISRIVGGRSQWEALKATLNKWAVDPSKANSITPAQRQQMNALIDAVDGKLNQKRQVIEGANQELINAGDVEGHRRVVANVRKKLADIDAGQGGSGLGDPLKIR